MRILATMLLSWNALVAAGEKMPHVLFVDNTQIDSIDPRLELRMQPPVKGPRVIWPTEIWESWAVFAYNSVVVSVSTRAYGRGGLESVPLDGNRLAVRLDFGGR